MSTPNSSPICVITGAGSGIGSGLTREAIRRGMRVIGADIDNEGLERVADSLGDQAAQFSYQTLDVTNAEAVGAFAEQVFAEHGQVNLLFNNAGVLVDGKCWERPLADWRWIIEVNFMGVLHGIHHFVPKMLKQNAPGRIVNTASIGGILGGGTFMSPYQTTKHAVAVLSESLYKELEQEPADITASVLCPAEVATQIWHSDRHRSDDERFDLGAAEQQFHDAVADNVAKGLDADTFATQVFAGIDANKFWLVPDVSFAPILRERTEDILATRNPNPITEIDF